MYCRSCARMYMQNFIWLRYCATVLLFFLWFLPLPIRLCFCLGLWLIGLLSVGLPGKLWMTFREDFGRCRSWYTKQMITLWGELLPRMFSLYGLGTCYSAAYMSQTCDQQHFTVSEMAADWHELMMLQRIMWPSIACANGQLDPQCS